MKIETLAVHAGRQVDMGTGAIAAPIQMSTTYERDADGGYARSFSYTRPNNPTRRTLETCLAALEGGSEAVCFASGTAASMAVFSLLKPGDHVIAPRECYHGTRQQLREIVQGWGARVDFVDPSRLDEVEAKLTSATRLVWIETPCNPTLKVTDIAAVSALARARGSLLAVDNTFATPIVQRPLELGADFVMHSSTKYFGGHSDVMGGAVIVREPSPLVTRIRTYQEIGGGVPSPFDCWLIRRSLATLPLRMRVQCANALEIARFLEQHPRVERVFYPGLAADPGHAVAAKQMRDGFGAVVSVGVKGGATAALAVAARAARVRVTERAAIRLRSWLASSRWMSSRQTSVRPRPVRA